MQHTRQWCAAAGGAPNTISPRSSKTFASTSSSARTSRRMYSTICATSRAEAVPLVAWKRLRHTADASTWSSLTRPEERHIIMFYSIDRNRVSMDCIVWSSRVCCVCACVYAGDSFTLCVWSLWGQITPTVLYDRSTPNTSRYTPIHTYPCTDRVQHTNLSTHPPPPLFSTTLEEG